MTEAENYRNQAWAIVQRYGSPRERQAMFERREWCKQWHPELHQQRAA